MSWLIMSHLIKIYAVCKFSSLVVKEMRLENDTLGVHNGADNVFPGPFRIMRLFPGQFENRLSPKPVSVGVVSVAALHYRVKN